MAYLHIFFVLLFTFLPFYLFSYFNDHFCALIAAPYQSREEAQNQLRTVNCSTFKVSNSIFPISLHFFLTFFHPSFLLTIGPFLEIMISLHLSIHLSIHSNFYCTRNRQWIKAISQESIWSFPLNPFFYDISRFSREELREFSCAKKLLRKTPWFLFIFLDLSWRPCLGPSCWRGRFWILERTHVIHETCST